MTLECDLAVAQSHSSISLPFEKKPLEEKFKDGIVSVS